MAAMFGALADVEDAGVLLIDAGGSATAQCFGGALASAARFRGVAGTLVHGAVRDTAELAELGFPAYSVGVYPVRLRGRLALKDTRVTVRLPDGPVDDGDFVIADADGAVFVPAARLPEVVAAARRIAAAGRALLIRLQDGGAWP
jgi:regulator of RNase E activity RraA